MTRILRAWPALLAATALTSCVSVPADDEPSVYGAFLAARYAGVNRDAAGAADYYMEALDRLPGALLPDVLQEAFQPACGARIDGNWKL